MKQGAVLMLAVALALSVPATQSLAAQPAPPAEKEAPYRCMRLPDIPADKQPAFRKVMNDFRAEMKQVYDDIYTKQMELEYLSRNNNVEPKMITDRIAEIREMHKKFDTIRSSYGKRLQSEVGLSEDQADMLLASCGRGFGGFHNSTRGPHMGRGMMGDDGGCPRWGGSHRGGPGFHGRPDGPGDVEKMSGAHNGTPRQHRSGSHGTMGV